MDEGRVGNFGIKCLEKVCVEDHQMGDGPVRWRAMSKYILYDVIIFNRRHSKRTLRWWKSQVPQYGLGRHVKFVLNF